MTFRRVHQRAKTIQLNDFVGWQSLGEEHKGRVTQVYTSGSVSSGQPRSHPLIASQNAPVVEIEEFEQRGSEWHPTGNKLVRPAMAVDVIADLRRPASFSGLMVLQKDKDEPAEIIMYGDIGEGGWWTDDPGITAKGVRESLAKIGKSKDIDLRLNSPGGDAFEGMAIYNVLAQHVKLNKIKLNVYNDGLVASAATVIAMAGSKLIAGQQSMFMIHRGWTIAIGNRNDMMQAVDMLDMLDGQTIDLYLSHVLARGAESDKDAMTKLVDGETYMDAQESVDQGFADEIFETRDKVAAYGMQRPWMHNALPSQLASKFTAPSSRVPGLMERAEAVLPKAA